jgi:hypothetical protein
MDLHPFQRFMPDPVAGASAVVAIDIPRVRCSTFPCHPNHSKVQSKLNQTHKRNFTTQKKKSYVTTKIHISNVKTFFH